MDDGTSKHVSQNNLYSHVFGNLGINVLKKLHLHWWWNLKFYFICIKKLKTAS